MSQRSIWSDLTPIEQQDGPSPLVPIMYSEEYRDAMNFFRALVAANEHSERALELTETIIRMNPSHYTVWQFRMDTILALDKNLEAELELMNEFAEENLKSYQVWHHRLTLLQTLNPARPSQEIAFIHRALQPDPKNYHTWAYLHWLHSFFTPKLSEADWTQELGWCEEMIEDDARNNSAWAWRWYLCVARVGAARDAEGEVKWTVLQIKKVPHNVSAWNYLRGLQKEFKIKHDTILPDLLPYTERPSSTSPAPASTEPSFKNTPLPVSYALEFLAESKESAGDKEAAAGLYHELQTEYDQMRAGYWAHRRLEAFRGE